MRRAPSAEHSQMAAVACRVFIPAAETPKVPAVQQQQPHLTTHAGDCLEDARLGSLLMRCAGIVRMRQRAATLPAVSGASQRQ
jgi:hypothetical protein